jgi:hypothetical protein
MIKMKATLQYTLILFLDPHAATGRLEIYYIHTYLDSFLLIGHSNSNSIFILIFVLFLFLEKEKLSLQVVNNTFNNVVGILEVCILK